MFKRAMTYVTLSASCLLLLGIGKICLVTESDMRRYKSRAEEYRTLAQQALEGSASQERRGVRKDIWFTQEDSSRLQYRIESDSSLLTLAPEGGKFDIVENLHNIRCWMQEKVFTTGSSAMQQLRFLQASDGTYSLSRQQFNAHSVALSLFKLPGHTLLMPTNTKQAFLKGTAEDISFTVSGKNPQFQAHNFSASLKQEDSK